MTPQELKNSILQLAIQGKLVEQRPEEGTGEELYKQIQAEKQALIKAGKIKKEKPFSTNIQFQDFPFDIPDTWVFVRFGELMISRDSERVPVSTDERARRAKVYDYYGASGVIDQIDDYLFDKELLLIGEDGANLLARSTPIAFLAHGKYWVNNHAHVLDACTGLDLKYVCYYINAISLTPYVTGTAQPKMNQENMNAIWVPLPPLAEQKRIVAKIEELLPLIDRYEAAWSRLEEFNKRFPEDMQKSILQYAIQGKLVEQRPEEGTGEELYQKIQAEKQKLIKEGKLKKDKRTDGSSTPSDNIIPFDIPETWKWTYLGNILNKLTDGTHKTPKYTTSGVKFVSVKDMSSGELSLENTKYISISEHEELFLRCDPMRGDMLLSKVGTTGVPAIVDTDEPFSLFVSVALLKYNHTYIEERFLYYLLQSPLVQGQATENTRGVGNKNWVLDAIANTVVVLPPLAEQKRIVKKIEELMQLVELLQKMGKGE